MILGGEEDGGSNRVAKRAIKSARVDSSHVMFVRSSYEDEMEISFGPQDERGLAAPHSDALVCSAHIDNCLVHRLFVDTGSAVNILYWECLKATGDQVTLKPPAGPLYGFIGEAVMPMGMVELPLSLGSPAMRKTRVIQFTTMEFASTAYNGILGRPALAAFKAVVSIAHLKMKFPVDNRGVGEVYGNQMSLRECYVKAMSCRKNLQQEPSKTAPKSIKRQKRSEANTHITGQSYSYYQSQS